MKFDVVITNAYIVDGSGEAPYTGCIGILDGVIAHIGTEDLPADATAERSIDAAGRVVAPGWVDVHSHFDAQAIWDPWLTPSCAAGVTTLVAGNWCAPPPGLTHTIPGLTLVQLLYGCLLAAVLGSPLAVHTSETTSSS